MKSYHNYMKSWRYKFYLFIAATLLSIYILIPTIFDFRSIREAAEKDGVDAPWYVSLFPQKQINLGLDLRGGIYLELEVGLDQALRQRSEGIATELERYAKENNLPYQKIWVLPKTKTIAVLADASTISSIQKHVQEFYTGALQTVSSSPLRTYQLPAEASPDLFDRIIQWSKSQNSILEIEKNQNQIEVVLRDPNSEALVDQELSSQFQAAKTPITSSLFLELSKNYQTQLKEQTLQQAVETIRNRIDRYGVAEPAIQKSGDNKVIVEIPGEKDPDRAVSLVKRSGQLEFKLVDPSLPPEKVQELIQQVRQEQKIPEGFSAEITSQINEALKGKIPADSEIAFENHYDPATRKIASATPYLLKKKVEVSGSMLKDARTIVNSSGSLGEQVYVTLSFNPEGTKAFADITAANTGRQLAIILDGVVNSAPNINEPIPNGEARITFGGSRNHEEAKKESDELVLVLREGAIPATLKEATKTVIGPSLGAAAISSGFKAALLAGGLVLAFMLFWYRGAGMVANAAVILNVLFIFAALALFGATLTLPGITGIVLTIGMAVDANVIILERIKEELAAGRGWKAAVQQGYANAMRAVLDANITTFLSGLVLYQFGTGPIKGFAVTLMIGIVTTLYTAVTLTKMYYDYRLSRGREIKLSL